MRMFMLVAFVYFAAQFSLLAYTGPTRAADILPLIQERGLQEIELVGFPLETDAPACRGRWRHGFYAIDPETPAPMYSDKIPMRVVGNVCCDDFHRCALAIDWSASHKLRQRPGIVWPDMFAHTLEDYGSLAYMVVGTFDTDEACWRNCSRPNTCRSKRFSSGTICIRTCSSDKECPPATRCSCRDIDACGGGRARLVPHTNDNTCAWVRRFLEPHFRRAAIKRAGEIF